MTLEIHQKNGYAVANLQGDVDLQNSPKVRKELLRCLEEKRDLLVHLGAVTYIDSSGVASLVEALQAARKNGRRFALIAVSPAAMRVLQLARLDRVFTISQSEDEALAAWG